MNELTINNRRIDATPRSKYKKYGSNYNAVYGGGGGSGTINTSNFVKLKGETSQTIEGTVASTADVVAYVANAEAGDIKLPIASTGALGCIKVGENLTISDDGTLSAQAGGGVSSWNDLTDKPVTFPSTWDTIAGKPEKFTPDTHTHIMKDITDFNAVTIDTNQVITGEKKFTKSILSEGDIIAYNTGTSVERFPIASKNMLGCVKIGNGLNINEEGVISVSGGSGTVSKWGDLTGTLSAQTDLWNALNNKVSNTQYATSSTAGIVKIGSGINISDNTISVSTSSINAATASHTHSNYSLTSHTHSNYSLTSHTHSQYLTDVSLSEWNAAATAVGNKNIGNSNNSNYVTIQEDLKVTQNAAFSKVPTVNGTAVALTSNLHNHSNLSYLNNVNQNLSTSAAVQHASLKCTGDVVAYTTGSASAPFKYWKPSVSTAGLLSWTNSTSETTPTSVNIKGAKGDKGDKGDRGLQGIQGVKGDKGDKGDRGATGAPGATFNGGTITNSMTIQTNSTSILSISGYNSTWQGAQIQMINKALSNYGYRWLIDLGGSSDHNGDLAFNSYNSSGTGSAQVAPYYRVKFLKHGNTNAVAGAGAYANTSDIRLKNRGESITNVLNIIDDLDVFHYTMKDDEDKIARIGVSAQEVQKYYPEFVSIIADEENEKILGVDYAGLGTTISIAGIKELKKENDMLKNKIDDLENKLNQLIKNLEKQ